MMKKENLKLIFYHSQLLFFSQDSRHPPIQKDFPNLVENNYSVDIISNLPR